MCICHQSLDEETASMGSARNSADSTIMAHAECEPMSIVQRDDISEFADDSITKPSTEGRKPHPNRENKAKLSFCFRH
jgi:hypothetical protein